MARTKVIQAPISFAFGNLKGTSQRARYISRDDGPSGVSFAQGFLLPSFMAA